jgi:ABC-type phosphonate transport system ATPase subunit
MCTVAKRLLFGPVIIELDEHSGGLDIQAVLYELCTEGQKLVPAVFVTTHFFFNIYIYIQNICITLNLLKYKRIITVARRYVAKPTYGTFSII